MSEGRFPCYHRLPPVVSAPQRHQLASAATPSVPHLFTFHPPANSHQLSLKFAKQDMAAYRKTPYASFHNGDGLQMHKPQYTPVTNRWMDSNNMPPPSRPGLTSPSSAYSVNVSPSFLLSRTVEFDLTKHKKESEQILIDLISNNKKYESFPYYKQEKDQVNNQLNSTKIETIEEKAMSVIAANSDKFINSEVRCDIPDSISNQNLKCVNTEDYENKFSKQDIKIECDEQMMEALFLTNESEKQSVIKIVKPIKSPSPSMMRAEFVEKILKSPSPIPGIEHDKSEDFIPSENSSKQKHDTHPQFIEEEKKLEKLFGGAITSTSTSDQQIMTENKSKSIISKKRQCNENKKQLKKVKKKLLVAEKLKKPKHDTDPQFIEVEKKLEELFSGAITSTSTSDQQIMTGNKSKPIISTKRPCNKNKKQLKKVKKNLPVAEKLKKPKHDTDPQFIEVEKKLEELFSGAITSTSTSDQQIMTGNKSKPIISTKRQCNENKKQLKKVKKKLLVAEKLKKPKHDTDPQFIEVEKKLEELFSGAITSTSTSDQQIMTGNKSKPIISTKRPCNKNKKQLKKVKKNLPVAEKLKKEKHDTHPQFIKVEKKLEELFGGDIISTSTSDQQIMTENKSKSIISTKRQCNENKKQLKKVKKKLLVAEKLKKQKHDTDPQFIEVEKKLEELFGGAITSTSTSDQQIMTENKSKSIVSTKRQCNENKKQLKKVKKNLPVAEKLKKQKHDTDPQFIEVEKKLEELFSGAITSTCTSDQQIMTENKSKPIISTKRPCNKNKKQLKKVKKNLPVAEKLKKEKHDTHPQFIEEKKLEKLFGGAITSTSTSDQQIMTENKSKSIISKKRQCNENKKQLKKVKKKLLVAEKLKKPKHDTDPQFIEVEKKLEELFSGAITSTSTSDQHIMTGNKSKPIISTKRPCNKNKKQLKKVKKNLPVAEKLKKEKHDTHPQFIKVEKKLEELFGGDIISTSTSDQQIMTENKSKSIISTKRQCNENKKQLKKVKKKLLVAEKLKKQKHDTDPQFIEVEKKLEELFGGAITSTSTSDQQIMTENKSKSIVSTKRQCNENKKQLKKVKKKLLVAEKLKTVVEPTTEKYKGPLVRINGGNIENPTNFVIINRNAQDDNDSLDSQNINRKTFTYRSGGCNVEEKPDVNNLESGDWKCVYCSRGPNVRNIVQNPSGDLFGPYYVRKPKVVKSNYNPKQKKTMNNLNDNDFSKTYIEVWTHANCLVWASGVYMVGDKIIGLEDSVRDVTNTICSCCGVNGASIGCIAHHCKMCAHYHCAIHFGWFLNSQNFMTTCNKHKNSPPGRSCH